MSDNKNLKTIFNSDINGLLIHSTEKRASSAEYKGLVNNMLSMGMNVLAQNVGLPDPVIYRSKVATTWDKYHNQVVEAVWGNAAASKDLQAASMKAPRNWEAHKPSANTLNRMCQNKRIGRSAPKLKSLSGANNG